MARFRRALVWLRRDLRLEDHVALAKAAELAEEVACVFVFDPKILEKLEDSDDRRLTFIHESLVELDEQLRARGSKLLVRNGDPVKEIPDVAKSLRAELVTTNRDYEPSAKKRDQEVGAELRQGGIEFLDFKDQVIFEGLEVVSKTGTAFKVFTPYKNAWLAKLEMIDSAEIIVPRTRYCSPDLVEKLSHRWTLADIGFKKNSLWLAPGAKAASKRLRDFDTQIKFYKDARDFPAQNGTSGLSAHLRFGTISVRACVRAALSHKGIGTETWLNELIWRDFYHMILDQNPHVVGHAFRKDYDSIVWPGSDAHFRAWCEGRTGYPIIDAAMRHFNETGWMHNRLRMVVASFLTKDLLIDWRKGEAYFARKLLDFDLAANNGGWQWSASTGCDAQPYFRVFNPYSQSEKFDPKGDFLRKHLPELKHLSAKDIHKPDVGGLFGVKYPPPIVDHSVQRNRAIALFK